MDSICLTEAKQASDLGICWAYIGTYMETKWKEYIGWEWWLEASTRVQSPTLPFASSVTWGKLLHLFDLYFLPHM